MPWLMAGASCVLVCVCVVLLVVFEGSTTLVWQQHIAQLHRAAPLVQHIVTC